MSYAPYWIMRGHRGLFCHADGAEMAGFLALLVGLTGERPVPMLAELADAIIGVDTHTDTHTAAVVDRLGAHLAAGARPGSARR